MTAEKLTTDIKAKVLEQYGSMYKAGKSVGVTASTLSDMVNKPSYNRAFNLAALFGIEIKMEVL